jgi:hypothetical protein
MTVANYSNWLIGGACGLIVYLVVGCVIRGNHHGWDSLTEDPDEY